MFNLQKQEITMKKYIAPVAHTIEIDSKESLMLTGSVKEQVGYGEASNRRDNTSWDFDDEEE